MGTDGSFAREHLQGGAAFVIPGSRAHACKIAPCVSSTHSELLAITIGTWLNPAPSISIYSDSTSAIQLLSNPHAKPSKYQHLISTFRHFAGSRRVNLLHVKAHTTLSDLPSRLNRAADQCAKNACSGLFSIPSPDLYHFLPSAWLEIEGVDYPAETSKKLYSLFLKHRLIPPNSTSGSNFTRKDIWLDPSLYTIRCGSPSLRLFAWKAFTRTLPTLATMNARHPSAFPTNLCPACLSSPETIEHIFLHCPAYRPFHTSLALCLATTLSSLPPPAGLTHPWITANDDSLDYHWDPGPCAAGAIPLELRSSLQHMTPQEASSLAHSINLQLTSILHRLWKTRCDTIRRLDLTWSSRVPNP